MAAAAAALSTPSESASISITYVSDVHTEFMPSSTVAFKFGQKCVSPDASIVVLSGDIGVLEVNKYSPESDTKGGSKRLKAFLQGVMIANKKAPILYVLGNHEYYNQTGTKFDDIPRLYKRFCARVSSRITVLQNEAVRIGWCVIFGSTFWTNQIGSASEHKVCTNDFELIGNGFDCSVWEREHNKAHNALMRANPDVVITHHSPDISVDNSKYGPDPEFESKDLEVPTRPRLWIFGHTHQSHASEWKGIYCVSNQLGYQGETLTKYQHKATVVATHSTSSK